MVHIVPSMAFIRDVKTQLEQGVSVEQAIQLVVLESKEPFYTKMKLWLAYYKNSLSDHLTFKTQYQKNLLEILRLGLQGAPIYAHLASLEQEMKQEFERQWKAYLDSLPMKLSIPLLLFFFPSYVILLFGPLVIQFLGEVQ